jgi:AraC-like DNA-binding protein
MLLRDDTFRRLCRARDMLREVRERPLLVEDVAREVQISPFHFIRQFEAVFGLTPHQFRIHSRLEAAKRLLAGGEYSVTEVCMEVGFSSLGSFSDLFTRRVGASPSSYQRRVRTMVHISAGGARIFAPGCLSLMAALPPSAFRSFREA